MFFRPAHFFVLVSLLSTFVWSQNLKTLAVVIGLECTDCGRRNMLPGVQNDLKAHDDFIDKIKPDRIIKIDERKWKEAGGKKSLLAMIQSIAKDYNEVLYFYSGHGLPIPRSAESQNNLDDPAFKLSDFELGMAGDDFMKCAQKAKINFRGRNECASQCENRLKETVCELEKYRDRTLCINQCTGSAYDEIDKKKMTNRKKVEDFKSGFLSACVTKKCLQLSVQEYDTCEKKQNDLAQCKTTCAKRRYAYPPMDERFSNTEIGKCIEDHVLLQSEIENLFEGKKMYAYIDSCYSGLMAATGAKESCILASASPFELAQEIDAPPAYSSSPKSKIGEFTASIAHDLETGCNDKMPLPAFFSKMRNRLTDQTPMSNGCPGAKTEMGQIGGRYVRTLPDAGKCSQRPSQPEIYIDHRQLDTKGTSQ